MYMYKKRYLLFCLLISGCSHNQVNLTDCLNHAKNDQEALTCYTEGISTDGKHTLQAHLKYINLLRRTDNTDKAVAALSNTLSIFGPSHQIFLMQGKLSLDQGNITEACRIFQHNIDQDSSDPVSLNGLAVAYDMKKQHLLAQKYYHKALKLMPNNTNYLINLGLSFIHSKNYKQAIHVLEPLQHIDHAKDNLGLAYAALGQKNKFDDLMADSFNKDQRDQIYETLRVGLRL